MARYLLRLSIRDFAKYKESDLHIIPKSSWNRLTNEERRQAREKGIVARSDDYQTHAGTPIEEIPIADTGRTMDDIDRESECAESPIASISGDERTWYVVRQVLDQIIAAPNARLEAECFRISSGLGMLDDITEASVARKHGITRAAVSKRCVRLTKMIGMRPSQYMRSLHMRETYRKARVRSLKKGQHRK